MLELNKRYKWKTISKEYPDLWAFITDIEEDGGCIESCKLLMICKHSEKAKYIRYFISAGIDFECERTTFSAPNFGFYSL
jgi:hypothetical protein